jgi:hypothetical protein
VVKDWLPVVGDSLLRPPPQVVMRNDKQLNMPFLSLVTVKNSFTSAGTLQRFSFQGIIGHGCAREEQITIKKIL